MPQTAAEQQDPLRIYSIGNKESEFGSEILTSKRLDYLDIFVLTLLVGGSRSGYKLYKDLRSEFETQVSFGTLYPRLRRLEKERIIIATKSAETSKISYELAPNGLELLKTNVREMKALAEKLSGLLQTVR